MRHIALEGRCFVLSSCRVIKRGAFPADYRCSISDDPDALLMRGGAVIISEIILHLDAILEFTLAMLAIATVIGHHHILHAQTCSPT